MNLLVVGSGGREHAIAWKLAQNKEIERVYCAPGNAGTALEEKCSNVELKNFASLVEFAKRKQVDLTLIGPEQPLAEGIVDLFEQNDLRIFGPTKAAAKIEASKVFSKELMRKAKIPTAKFSVFEKADDAKDFVKYSESLLVVKAGGLAAGKGAIVCSTKAEALDAVEKIMVEKIFGEAGKKIVIEERLFGEEVSLIAFTDSKHVSPMLLCQDHKQVFSNDKGPNTGGMGAYAPVPHIGSKKFVSSALEKIFYPAIKELRKNGIKYKGVLYAGLVVSKEKQKVLEFNCRFGDPETQAILPLMESSLLNAVNAVIDEKLKKEKIKWSSNSACCVVIASQGYPSAYEKGKEIFGIKEAEKVFGAKVFHAGTVLDEKKILSSDGRVLNVTGTGKDIIEARNCAYEAVRKISFEGMHYRSDIGRRALEAQL